jgi:D-alanine--poly(phosphoribitol) ligase subunit 1
VDAHISARAGGPDPSTGLSRLPMLAGTRRIAARRSLRNPHPVDTTTGAFAHVTARAAADPDRVAVTSAAEAATYGQLHRRIRQWQASLRAVRCGPGDRVGVAGPRSIDTIAAFLAIEGIGAAYLPVDPAWPSARLAEMLRHAAPRCLVIHGGDGQSQTACRLAAAQASVQVVSAPDPAGPVAPPPVPRDVADDEPRYIIHTSGSTGRPKGAIVTQLGLMNHLWSIVARLRLTASDTVAFSAPPSYVISVWQMVAVLLAGGRVTIVDEVDRRFGRRLAARAARAGISVLELVPTELGWLVDHLRGQPPAALPDLRCVVSTGEKLDPALAAAVHEVLPHVELLNAYGSTECSDDVSLCLIEPADLTRPRLSVGAPIPNAVLYLLVCERGRWRSARRGEPGELWVGGSPVGLGYLNDPELTQAAFFVDEFDSCSSSGRIYRTGDLAVFEDGRAYCLGRADRQVKIAGVRIELDEVEAAVARITGLRQCAVVVEEHEGEARLAAHYAGRPGTDKAELYAHLRESLPPALLPRRWIRHDSLPVNASGKVDRRALGRLCAEEALL